MESQDKKIIAKRGRIIEFEDRPKLHVGYMAQDQYGNTYIIGNNPPRKWLLNYFDCKHAEKMYRDAPDGKVRHVGYIIAGLWLEIYCVTLWKEAS